MALSLNPGQVAEAESRPVPPAAGIVFGAASLLGVLAALQVAWRPGPHLNLGWLLLIHVPEWASWAFLAWPIWWFRTRLSAARWTIAWHTLLCPLVILVHAGFVAGWDLLTLSDRIDVGWLEIVRRHLAGSALYEVLGYLIVATVVELSLRPSADVIVSASGLANPAELVIRSANSISRVRLREVQYLEASGNYVRVHTDERTFSLRASLTSIHRRLDDRFLQVHRSRIVNRDHVAGVHSRGRHRRWVELRSGHRLKVSPAGWQRLAVFFKTE